MSLTRIRLMRQAWGEQEMQFADPYAQQVFNEKYGRMTLNKVRSVKIFLNENGHDLDWLFANNENVQSFEELRYFTNLTKMLMTFRNCYNLAGTITIPASVKVISGACILNTKLTGVEILPQDFVWQTGFINRCPLIRWVIMHAIVPQLNSVSTIKPFGKEIENNEWKLYVPDDSVSTYRASRDYSYLGDRIRPMSEFKE